MNYKINININMELNLNFNINFKKGGRIKSLYKLRKLFSWKVKVQLGVI